ncbi:MAG: putative mucin/carbohydrate-binding domain-containing protein [Cetobacterium sp.]
MSLKVKSNESIEEIKIYRNTSLSTSEDSKQFNYSIHSNEPLGIKILQSCSIEVLIEGQNIVGDANINLHNIVNLKGVKKIPVNIWTQIDISEMGGLFIDVQNIKNKLDSVDERFSFSVKVKMNKSDYILASIFDIRNEKISENTLSKEAFHEKVFLNENGDDPGLLISDNVRIYIPMIKHLIKKNNEQPMDILETLEVNEEIIALYNKLAGLNENNEKDMHKPRKGFFLVTGREEHRGYMSAGSTMLDCAPNNILAYFGRPKKGEAVWGMYHEYGHLYEQGWGFTEYWNNMFANAKTRIDKNDPTWSWAYGNKQQYEETKVVPSYSDYLTKGEQYKRIVPMYFFLAFIDSIDNEFMQKLETFWREEGKYSGWDFVAYFIAKQYKLNVIPFIKMCELQDVTDFNAIDDIIDLSKSSYIYTDENYWFDSIRNISIPPTVRKIYPGRNRTLSGIANPEAEIEIELGQNRYTVTADSLGKFSFLVPETIYLNSEFKIKSTEKNKVSSHEIDIIVSDDKPKLFFKGYKDEVFLRVEFDFVNKKFIASSSGVAANVHHHSSEYIVIEHYNKKNKLKNRYSVAGSSNADYVSNLLNETKFIEGDYLKLSHKEQFNRLALLGEIRDTEEYYDYGVKNLDLSNSYFYIMKSDILYSTIQLELNENKDDLIELIKECNYDKDDYSKNSYNEYVLALGKSIEVLENDDALENEIIKAYRDLEKAIQNLRKKNKIIFKGYNNVNFCEIVFNDDSMMLEAKGIDTTIHPFHGSSKYAEIKLFNRRGIVKGNYSIKANESSLEFAKGISTLTFEETDYIKLYHLEKNSRMVIEGFVENTPSNLNNGCSAIDLENSYFYILNENLKYSNILLDLSDDKTKLKDKIEELEKLDSNIYTKLSFNNLQMVIQKAKQLLETPNLTEQEIILILEELNEVENALREKNKILFKGYNNVIFSELTFNYDLMKFEASGIENMIHPYQYSRKYSEVILYNRKGMVKGSCSVNANENSMTFANSLNAMNFEETDYIKLYHLEKNARLVLNGFIEDAPYDLSSGCLDIDLENSYFYILNENLKYTNTLLDLSDDKSKLKDKIDECLEISPENYTKVSYNYLKSHIEYATSMLSTPNLTQVEIDLEVQRLDEAKNNLKEKNKVIFKGYNNVNFLELTFNYDLMKFEAKGTDSIVHPFHYGRKYGEVILCNKKGIVKASYSVNANENSIQFANNLNKLTFEETDFIKLYHLEKDRRLVMDGFIENTPYDLSTGCIDIDLENSYFYILNENLKYSDILLDLSDDKTELRNKVEEYSQISSEKYTKKSYDYFKNHLNYAQSILEVPNLTTDEINLEIERLDIAKNKLREKNIVIFKGYNNTIFSELTFNYDLMKFEATGIENMIHPYQYSRKYSEVVLFNKKGIEKGRCSVNANENSMIFANSLNAMSFEETDYIKLYHLEKNARLVLNGFIEDAPYELSSGCIDIDLENSYFYIINENLKYTDTLLDLSDDKTELRKKVEEYSQISSEKYTKISYNYFRNHLDYAVSMLTVPNLNADEISLEIQRLEEAKNKLREKNKVIFKGYNNVHFLELTFNYDLMKFEAKGREEIVHPFHYGRKYAELVLFSKGGVIKGSCSVNANENSLEFATALNNLNFEETDYIKLYHLEKDSRLVIEGFVEDAPYDLSTGCFNINLENSYFAILNENLKYYEQN